ncbi:MAG: PhoH family protein [Candidatus Aureabacteria bacterium]|nr:PhoH family protein [Candidatus Auribacterota bacterium]
MKELRIDFENPHQMGALVGRGEEHLKTVERAFGVSIVSRGHQLKIMGAEEGLEKSRALFAELAAAAREGSPIRGHEVKYAIRTLQKHREKEMTGFLNDRIKVASRRSYVSPKTGGQKAYVDAIRGNDIVFGIGPAGTGKTYLAMAMAVEALLTERVSRIILTRPAVEAGESLGFLPGDLYEKITPYLRPLYDALYDMMEVSQVQRHIERGTIEIAPLAYMRGRTLNDSFIILDEAQNSTAAQMKMFLTRLGFDSKTVVTGDITQVDLPGHRQSGLVQVQGILEGIKGVAFAYFTEHDVVRHELVQEIIRAYARADQKALRRGGGRAR